MNKWFNFRDIDNFEFVGVAMRNNLYLGPALTDFNFETSFRNVIKFPWHLFHKKISFCIKLLIKRNLEVDKWRKNPQPGLMFNYANLTISTFCTQINFFGKNMS